MTRSAPELILPIEKIVFGGDGLMRHEGRVGFVPFVAPGETVRVMIRQDQKDYFRATLVEVVQPSPHRVAPPCPYFGVCGGCNYQHINDSHQLEIKDQQLRETLLRAKVLSPDQEDITWHPPQASPQPLHYRNRITLHSDGRHWGFHAHQQPNKIVRIDQCLLAAPSVNQKIEELQRRPESQQNRTLRAPDLRGGVFHQTNPALAELLAEYVASQIPADTKSLLDLYCGTGFFTQACRGKFQTATGIDWSARNIEVANSLAQEGEEFLQGDVAMYLPHALAATQGFAILDPPREGLSEEVREILKAGRLLQRFVYVSCNPATLARDLASLQSKYRINTVKLFDMFPQTAEIESVVTLMPTS
ncbi:MAG: class I SAM-dependent RNA methyltransferase [Verrucomicrobiales bacterium]